MTITLNSRAGIGIPIELFLGPRSHIFVYLLQNVLNLGFNQRFEGLQCDSGHARAVAFGLQTAANARTAPLEVDKRGVRGGGIGMNDVVKKADGQFVAQHMTGASRVLNQKKTVLFTELFIMFSALRVKLQQFP